MKASFVVLLFLFSAAGLNAGEPYHNYLLSRINSRPLAVQVVKETSIGNQMSIPRYRLPAGSVFCRLEDKLTRATKVWVKIGVK